MELKGKIINFLGDSITEGVGVVNREDHRFTALIEKNCSCSKVNNYGIGGSRIAHQSIPSAKARHDMNFCGRCYDMDKNADIVCIFGGVNDYFHGDAAFGEINSSSEDRNTFCGALRFLCKTVKEFHPNAKLVFFAPAHCVGDTKSSTSINKPVTAKEHRPLIDYVNAILKIAPSLGFYTYSMYDNLGIDPNKQSDCEKYTSDGIHFNDCGHEILADKIVGFLKTI